MVDQDVQEHIKALVVIHSVDLLVLDAMREAIQLNIIFQYVDVMHIMIVQIVRHVVRFYKHAHSRHIHKSLYSPV